MIRIVGRGRNRRIRGSGGYALSGYEIYLHAFGMAARVADSVSEVGRDMAFSSLLLDLLERKPQRARKPMLAGALDVIVPMQG